MLDGMAKTTISIDSAVRDRLATLAEAHGRPMGEEIAYLIDVADERDFWTEVSIGYSHGSAGESSDVDEFPEYADLGPEQTYPTPDDMHDDFTEIDAGRSAA
jgi:hypothetical protein